MQGQADITRLLNAWSHGDEAAGEELAPLVYEHLRARAHHLFRGEKAQDILQPTALVHEAFARLAGVDVTWQDRAHFLALASRMMRRLLINEANARLADKRGGAAVRVALVDDNLPTPEQDANVLALSEAITKLANVKPAQAQLIELRYFGGLSIRELEEVTGRSSSSLGRDLRFARAWLRAELTAD